MEHGRKWVVERGDARMKGVEKMKDLERKDGNDGKEELLPHFFLL